MNVKRLAWFLNVDKIGFRLTIERPSVNIHLHFMDYEHNLWPIKYFSHMRLVYICQVGNIQWYSPRYNPHFPTFLYIVSRLVQFLNANIIIFTFHVLKRRSPKKSDLYRRIANSKMSLYLSISRLRIVSYLT